MKEYDNSELPLIDTPPFHRPATEEEIARFMLEPDASPLDRSSLDIGDGWTLSFFSVAATEGRQPATGWVKGDFGVFQALVNPRRANRMAVSVLCHLHEGRIISMFARESDATFAAAMLARELDWSDQSSEAIKAQNDKYAAAMRANFKEIARTQQGRAIGTRRTTSEIVTHG